MADLCQIAQPSYKDSRSLAKKNGLTPSERSVTRFLTATSRPLTLAFNLDSKTLISHRGLEIMKVGIDRPFGECLLLNRYPLLLHPHLHEVIGHATGTAEGWDLIMVEAVAVNDAVVYSWRIGEKRRRRRCDDRGY